MTSVYLLPGDVATFGAPNATPELVKQASALIDAYLLRPHGLIWVADANGMPAYMAAMSPELTCAAVGAIAPGVSVQVQVSGPTAALQVGDCAVLDRSNANAVEAIQITGISGNVVTLGSTAANQPQGVQFAHAAGCTIEVGMMITETRYLPKQRSEVMLGHTPVARVVGGTGRYGYGRHGDAGAFALEDFNLLAAVSKFGGPPAWEIWPANTSSGINSQTGQLWVPAGILLAYYSEVKVRYIAGFNYANLPAPIKLACAQIANAIAQDPQIGNFKKVSAGDTAIERFAASNIGADVKAMLQPWRARAFA